MANSGVNECIEALCLKGCEAVRAAIAAMERGEPVPPADRLDAEARAEVLAELKNIMAVYDKPQSAR